MSKNILTTPNALLLTAPGCPHCPTVRQGLDELVKQGFIGTLEVVNIAEHPERAETLNVRTVPWVKIGPFELEGLRSPAELRSWAQRAGSITGTARYFEEFFKEGKLEKVSQFVQADPNAVEALLILASDKDAELTVRIGVSAIIEELEGSETLNNHFDSLRALSENEDPRVRSDACHFLTLTHNPEALELLNKLAQDPERSVRDIAVESLNDIQAEVNKYH
jgi:glutaredoxin